MPCCFRKRVYLGQCIAPLVIPVQWKTSSFILYFSSMQKSFLILAAFFLAFSASAQGGRWMVTLNGKLMVAAGTENTGAHTRQLKRAEWKKNGYLEIKFTEDEPATWRRSFIFNDEGDEQLLTKDSVTAVKIPLSALRKIFAGKKELTIYTIIAPLDPSVAIRIRRVHLCTLKLP